MRIRTIALGLLLAATLAACSSSTPATATPPAATPTPVVTPEPTAAPTATGPDQTQGPMPSFNGDPTLAAKFPTQVGGQPVTTPQTARLVDFFAAFQTTQAEIETIRQALAKVGIDIDTVTFGSATTTVNGASVGIVALRIPGQDAGRLIQNYALISPSNATDVLTPETVGGKSATKITGSDGTVSGWMYASGDTLWQVNTTDVAEAAAVFSALQ
jgi:hypothetical protein